MTNWSVFQHDVSVGEGKRKEDRKKRRAQTKARRSAWGEGEDEEAALAGDDDGEEAAVGGDGKFAEGEAVEDGNRRGL